MTPMLNLEKYKVEDILPVVILFKDNQEILRLIGENDLKDVESLLVKYEKMAN